MTDWKKAYHKWASFAALDPELKDELKQMKDDELALEDAFYKELTFGTGGMRGILGPGTNRMNIYTVRKAVNGLAIYLQESGDHIYDQGVVIAYDSRYQSQTFALEAAKVLGAFDIKAYVFESIRPTPVLSFAVRHLQTAAGIMITASHNPPEYNGFKVYNDDGGQMVPEEADAVIEAIRQIDDELTIPVADKNELEEKGRLVWVGDDVDCAYLQELKNMSRLDADERDKSKDLNIVFTPLHGTAYDHVMRGLRQLNFSNVAVVDDQTKPDPEFSTVSSPNPEEHQAFTMAIEKGQETDADILLGTDPDADRLGVAVKNASGEYTVLTGNQLGSLLLDYLLSHSDSAALQNGRALKTIVTTELGRRVAEAYGVKMIDTLTGFKYIAEKIRQFDKTGEMFLFGFEESYGYLASSFSRDKDAVQIAVLASEMAWYWKKKGKTLLEALDMLYDQHGYYMEDMSSVTLKGKKGSEQIAAIMREVRNNPLYTIAGLSVEQMEDYATSKRTFIGSDQAPEAIDLPQENVVKFILEQDAWVCLRPSGTEPKIKCYYGVCTGNRQESERLIRTLKQTMEEFMDQVIQSSE